MTAIKAVLKRGNSAEAKRNKEGNVVVYEVRRNKRVG